MKKKKVIALIVAIVAFFCFLALALYPVLSSMYIERHQAELELQYKQQMEERNDKEIEEAREQAILYNKAIVPGTQNQSAFTQEAQLNAAKNYGNLLNLNGDSIMGYVKIPKISVNLPIFHGTDTNILESGIGHLVGSSLPVGGESTHTILTGHSGMASKKMFTNLEDLVVGDVFYLEVLDETLAYQVDQLKVVEPYQVADLCIEEGKDYCTLITCTPYAVNTHRLLVRGIRIPYEKAEEIIQVQPQEEVKVSAWEKGYIKGIVIGLAMAFVLLLVVLVVYLIKRWRTRKAGKYATSTKGTDFKEDSK